MSSASSSTGSEDLQADVESEVDADEHMPMECESKVQDKDVLVKNTRPKIIHCIPDAVSELAMSSKSNDDLLQRSMTACGRRPLKNMS